MCAWRQVACAYDLDRVHQVDPCPQWDGRSKPYPEWGNRHTQIGMDGVVSNRWILLQVRTNQRIDSCRSLRRFLTKDAVLSSFRAENKASTRRVRPRVCFHVSIRRSSSFTKGTVRIGWKLTCQVSYRERFTLFLRRFLEQRFRSMHLGGRRAWTRSRVLTRFCGTRSRSLRYLRTRRFSRVQRKRRSRRTTFLRTSKRLLSTWEDPGMSFCS